MKTTLLASSATLDGIKAVIAGSTKAEQKLIEDNARKNLHKLMEEVICKMRVACLIGSRAGGLVRC